MKRAIFDLEADGLLDTASKVHCISVITDDKEYLFDPPRVKEGLDLLLSMDELVGHNILCYDLVLLEELYGVKFNCKVFDTLLVSRLIYTDLFDIDARKRKIPKTLWGNHKLEAWGHRTGERKGDYTGGWESYSSEMGKYCMQDSRVTKRLYNILKSKNYSQRAIDLEHEFQRVIHKQETNGVLFDVTKAKEMDTKVVQDIESLKTELNKLLPFRIKRGGYIKPKTSNSKAGRRAGCAYNRISLVDPNAGSRSQVVDFFKRKYGWQPTIFTDNNNPKVDDEVLRGLEFPEADQFARLFERIKIRGFTSSGKSAWLKLQRNGRLYGRVITNGAVTGRCTHSSPNLGQVPAVRSYLGKECRELFHAGNGWMIGADASGLELRMLAHYMYKYDGGSYAKEVTTGDIHTRHQHAGQLATRDDAKTFIYAFLYGAGDAKLGAIVTGTKNKKQNKKAGKALRNRFISKIPGMGQLISDVKSAAARGYLNGLDGRKLHVRSDHKALNTLLQGAGAVVMKQANVNFYKECTYSYQQVLNVHDEFQVTTLNKEQAPAVGEMMVGGIIKAGEDFNLNCELNGEYKIGKNWAETH